MAAETTTAPPPAAPTAAPAAPATPAPSELHVTAQTVTDKGPPPAPPKPGSARERMFEDLRKKASPTNAPPPAKPAAEANPPEGGKAPVETEKTGETPAAGKVPEGGEPGKKERVNPWKLMEEHKAARLNLEQQLAELKKSLPDAATAQAEKTRVEQMTARLNELEEEIRYTNFSKSREFADKYQKPYEDAWKKAMADLGELTVPSPEGGERPLAPEDILSLVNLPLKEARAKADELFGEFADDVMAHRKEIRNLFDAQNQALSEARKNGAERDKQRLAQFQQQQQALHKEIGELWTQSNESAIKDEKFGKYFSPIEGDEEGNNRLQRGFAMADRAFQVDPRDPRLTPEQRKDIVRLHSAIRNRAAAFGRTLFLLQKSEAQVAELKSELAKYKNAEPGAGAAKPPDAAPAASSAHDSVFGALRKLAH